MKAAIAIDDWKLPIFDKHLSKAGYVFEKKRGIVEETFTLIVETDDMKRLGDVIMAANTEAKKKGR